MGGHRVTVQDNYQQYFIYHLGGMNELTVVRSGSTVEDGPEDVTGELTTGPWTIRGKGT